ncbi:ABC transporter permease [Fredinandcohnia sp. QZ13]|uniref:ABC transporter permease n=1 Tax=Fredinandcohnia sp. QZ13 TaxID=3073144 RepID=UPI0028533486|nr:ABC transporter permease [Fredinandcohnia sp. QZ13]MDR4889898.1 ABC transporter permease [Fredinandcohnia sp. QZ13]
MSFKSLIFRNLVKNIKNYYLYVFALIFSVALYFAFVTLQYDPSMDVTEGSVKGAAAMKAASVMLIGIVTVFLVYANTLFIKRRGKEIGLFQLVGISKRKTFWILSVENMILYFGSMIIGIFLGFVSSKLVMMILLKIIGIEEVARLHFSIEALAQTVIVFAAIYIVIMLLNALFIKRQQILSLFHSTSTSEERKRKVSVLEVIMGILGLALILFGYYLSTKLFDGQFTMMEQMFMVMLVILVSVIIGTYFFYKGSIRFIFNLIRKKDNGYLSVNKVLSLSSIMFRMRSNSVLLTVITTVSALALGLLSLTYISYYSAEKAAEESVVNDFSIPNEERAKQFTDLLDAKNISYTKTEIDLMNVKTDLTNVLEVEQTEMLDLTAPMTVVSDRFVEDIDVAENESVFVNSNSALQAFMTFKTGPITMSGKTKAFELNYSKYEDKRILPLRLTGGGFPVAIVDDAVYQQLAEDVDPEVITEFPKYVGIDIEKRSELKEANQIFNDSEIGQWAGHQSQLDILTMQKQNMGFMMFIVGFLGLTFLITSGCILYFKQMDEGEEEKGSYTILRKLGFTRTDLLNGIKAKQLFNFGIPLIVGLCHSYFAVKSGWFFFGTELWAPMIIVMVFYTLLYSIFGILSVMYYKKLIKEAL